MIARSAFLGAASFGFAFAMALIFSERILSSALVALGTVLFLSAVRGEGFTRTVLGAAVVWFVASLVLLPGGPMAGILAVHLDTRMGEMLARTALWGAVGGAAVGAAMGRGWRCAADCGIAGALALPGGLSLGGALIPFITAVAPPLAVVGVGAFLFRYAIMLAGGIGGALAGAGLGVVVGYYTRRRSEEPIRG